jgi:hypothetical protein
MLETSQERIKSLKAGMSPRTMEQLYLLTNNFKVIGIPLLFEAVEVRQEDIDRDFFCEVNAEYVNA